ncbi:MAG: ribose 5-phosphate isomerase B [Candidatus Spyradocola sp.]|nr:ribose 5-phosphate isomerase B [Candidatus Spyradocola sp.]
MMIALGSDHAAYKLKLAIAEHLKEKGIEFEDLGCYGTESVNYPEYGQKVAEAVAAGKYEYGIVVCGTGIGISLAANKVPGIRCAVCSDTYSAKYTRLHNDANMLAMGERVVGQGLAMEIVDTFLSTGFEGGRHAKRVDMITAIEKKYNK